MSCVFLIDFYVLLCVLMVLTFSDHICGSFFFHLLFIIEMKGRNGEKGKGTIPATFYILHLNSYICLVLCICISLHIT